MTKRNKVKLLTAGELLAMAQKAETDKGLRDAMKTWRESVQREAGILLANRDPSARQYLEENKNQFTNTELDSYLKTADAIVYGGPKGDARVMDQYAIDVYNVSTVPGDGKPSAQSVRDRLVASRRSELVNNERFTTWITHLDGEIGRQRTDAKGLRDKAETELKQQQERRFTLTMQNVDRVFVTTTKLEQLLGTFDPVVAQAAALFREEIQRQSIYTGRGNREADDVYRERLPYWLGHVESNANARLGILREQLKGRTPSQLKALETTMPKEQWLELLRASDESRAIEAELANLKARATLQGTPGSTPAPAAKPQTSGSNPRAGYGK